MAAEAEVTREDNQMALPCAMFGLQISPLAPVAQAAKTGNAFKMARSPGGA